MRVIVADQVFDGQVSSPSLLVLLGFAFLGRHRILVARGPFLERWMKSLPDDAREIYEHALDVSAEVEAREPSDHEIHVGTAPGALLIEDAIERLGRPFVLFLEDERSDRAFLDSIASPPYREHLRKLQRRGWIAYRSHGGVANMKKLLVDELDEFPDDAWRMFAFFDSDARAPGKPHKHSADVAQACTERRVPFRMLKRRAIENYLTRHALQGWAANQSDYSSEAILGCIEMFYGEWFNQRPERRHHFPMKDGFARGPLDPMYDDVPGNVKRCLLAGFPRGVTEAFKTELIRAVDLRAEDAWDELSEIVEALIRSMR